MALQHVPWTNHELLELNRKRLLKELGRKLSAYEARYELESSRVEQELVSGRLRETAEICDWVLALHTLQALDREGETRME